MKELYCFKGCHSINGLMTRFLGTGNIDGGVNMARAIITCQSVQNTGIPLSCWTPPGPLQHSLPPSHPCQLIASGWDVMRGPCCLATASWEQCSEFQLGLKPRKSHQHTANIYACMNKGNPTYTYVIHMFPQF